MDALVEFIKSTDQCSKSEDARKGLENRLNKLDDYFERVPPPHSKSDYHLKNKMGSIELGDDADCSLKGSGMFVSLSTSLYVDMAKLKSCVAHLKYDDHCRLFVNDKRVFASIDDGGTEFNVVNSYGTNYVDTGVSKVPAETGCSHYNSVDLMSHLHTGCNNLFMQVIVEHFGCCYMKVDYVN